MSGIVKEKSAMGLRPEAAAAAETSMLVAHYLEEKACMGLLSPWDPEIIKSGGLHYTRNYNGHQWTPVCSSGLRWNEQVALRYTTHAGTFCGVIMPEMHRMACERKASILVQPYAPQDLILNGFWRLEVDEKKEEQGIWEFKEGILVTPSTMLHLTIMVLGFYAGTFGAKVER